MANRYWLFKSDPETFGWDDLARAPKQTTRWDGIRNYQARNSLRDDVRLGDGVLFHHSQSDPPAIVGIAAVSRAGYPDETQFESRSPHFDSKAQRDAPRWFAVDIRLERGFPKPVPLTLLRATPGLDAMVLLQKGSRLSVQPVSAAEWKIVVRLAGIGSKKTRE